MTKILNQKLLNKIEIKNLLLKEDPINHIMKLNGIGLMFLLKFINYSHKIIFSESKKCFWCYRKLN
jgi:hypothetical protein